MTYYESAEGIRITQARAFAELRAHSIFDTSAFLADMGDQATYRACDVLDWLGY